MEYAPEQNSPSYKFKSSPSSWIKSKTLDLPEEIKEKFSTFLSKIVKSSRRSNNTSEFRYDPTSYALNFEDEAAPMDIDEWSFSARLPLSSSLEIGSDNRFPAADSRQIAACS